MVDTQNETVAKNLAQYDPMSEEFQAQLAKLRTERGINRNAIDYSKDEENNFANREPIFSRNKQLDNMKSLADEMDEPVANNGVTGYDLTAMDVQELTDLVNYVAAGSKEMKDLTNDLDKSLTELHGAGQAKFDDVIENGQKSLHKADEAAKKAGIDVPKRAIDKVERIEDGTTKKELPKVDTTQIKQKQQNKEIEASK